MAQLITRRQFLWLTWLGALHLMVPLPACRWGKQSRAVLTDEESQILEAVLAILFPEDGEGPGYRTIRAAEYVQWVLADPFYHPGRKEELLDGLTALQKLAQGRHRKPFWELNEQEQDALVAQMAADEKHQGWLSLLLTLILEALLADPIYGGNPSQVGWQWLDHYVGVPRPDEATRYDRIYPWKVKD